MAVSWKNTELKFRTYHYLVIVSFTDSPGCYVRGHQNCLPLKWNFGETWWTLLFRSQVAWTLFLSIFVQSFSSSRKRRLFGTVKGLLVSAKPPSRLDQQANGLRWIAAATILLEMLSQTTPRLQASAKQRWYWINFLKNHQEVLNPNRCSKKVNKSKSEDNTSEHLQTMLFWPQTYDYLVT